MSAPTLDRTAKPVDMLMLASAVNGAQIADMLRGPRHYIVFLTLEDRDAIVEALKDRAEILKVGRHE